MAQPETQAENDTLEPFKDLSEQVEVHLRDLHALLKDAPERAKAEFRRLHLQVVLHPIEAEPGFRAERSGAPLRRLKEHGAP